MYVVFCPIVGKQARVRSPRLTQKRPTQGRKSPLPSSWQGRLAAEPSFGGDNFESASQEQEGKVEAVAPKRESEGGEAKDPEVLTAAPPVVIPQPTGHVEAQASVSSNTTEVLESGLQDAMQALGMLTTSSLGAGGGAFQSSSTGAGADGQMVIGHKTKQGIMVITERDLPEYELLVPEDPNSLSLLEGRDFDGGGGGRGRGRGGARAAGAAAATGTGGSGGGAGMLSSHASPIHIRRLNGARVGGASQVASGEKGSDGTDWDRASLRLLLRHSDKKARGKFKGDTKSVAASEPVMQKRRVWRGRPFKK